MPSDPAGPGDSRKRSSHPVRDGFVSGVIVTAEAISALQGAHVIATPTTPAGRPLVTQEERDLADVKRKQDEDRQFDLGNALRPPDEVEQRNRDRGSQPER